MFRQTEEARTEAIQLMGVKNNLVTPRNGEPLIAATQDFITASYLLSRKDVFYDRTQFTLICSYMSDALSPVTLPHPAILKVICIRAHILIGNIRGLLTDCPSYASP